ncbi:hypothetical protein NMG60_11034897 [Bertholletia excelsa]
MPRAVFAGLIFSNVGFFFIRQTLCFQYKWLLHLFLLFVLTLICILSGVHLPFLV